MVTAISMPRASVDQGDENNDPLVMSAVSMAVESTLCARHAFAITRLSNSAVFIHPSPRVLINFYFLCCFVF